MVAKLHDLFHPKTIAIIGASNTPGKVGNVLAERASRGGFPIERIIAVNPKSTQQIAGLQTVHSIKELEYVPDLAVITTPPEHVPGIARECATLGVKHLLVITSGFGEVHTPEGDRLQCELDEALKGSATRMVGPNCFGIMNMQNGLDLTFGLTGVSAPGYVSILSQSGGVAAALVDRARGLGIGLNKVVTMGNASDLSWREYLSYLGDDVSTHAIFLYIEGIGRDTEGFLAALREVSEQKLVVVFKPGRSEAAAKAAATHTGSLAGDDRVFDAAIRRTQAIRVDSLAEMFYMAAVSNQELPRSDRYTFITNGGGSGVIAADRAALCGLTPAKLTDETITALDAILPANWSHGNPVDIIGDANRERYYRSVRAVLADPNVESVIIMYIPTALSPPEEVAKGIIQAVRERRASGINKPIFVVWTGGWSISGGEKLLEEAGLPVIQNPDTAARILGYLAEYRRRHAVLYQTPRGIPRITSGTLAELEAMLRDIRETGRTLLAEDEAKAVLRMIQIPTNTIRVARSTMEAMNAAIEIGYPVVVKAHAEIFPGVDPSLSHKSEFGVHLNLKNYIDVAKAFEAIRKAVTEKLGEEAFCGVTVQSMVKTKDAHELFLGTTSDPNFGPVLLFGRGGTQVEYFGDTAMGVNQLSSAQMRQTMEQTRMYRVLQGVRGLPSADIAAVVDAGVRLSQLATSLSGIIRSIEMNPLLAGPDGVCALDARIELFGKEEVGRKPAIRPYPAEWVRTICLADGEAITIRPIDASDEEKMRDFHGKVSADDVYRRFLSQLPYETRIRHERLSRLCNIGYRGHMAFVAENDKGEIVSVARIVRANSENEFEMAFFTRSDQKRRGIGTFLMEMILEWAARENIPKLAAITMRTNEGMRRVFEKAGFSETPDPEDRSMILLEKTISTF